MRAVVQRVSRAKVTVMTEEVASIGNGLLVLLGAGEGDAESDVDYLARKIVGLRIFEDVEQNMNRSLMEVEGELLVVSQFTLYGDCRKGRRPSFIKALRPDEAERLCNLFVARCRELGAPVKTGRFRAMMDVELCNEGPVTVLLDSQKQF
ncbi:MAG: D-aminoacyl-tRNA deacylase [Pseudomonadota bacterium]